MDDLIDIFRTQVLPELMSWNGQTQQQTQLTGVPRWQARNKWGTESRVRVRRHVNWRTLDVDHMNMPASWKTLRNQRVNMWTRFVRSEWPIDDRLTLTLSSSFPTETATIMIYARSYNIMDYMPVHMGGNGRIGLMGKRFFN